ncbi:MAG: cupin domain-containing protein [Lachnospiraceae bacterium]|nr:cupin domain-containing protein [Lachnospiraceae bacterium]
MKIVLLSGGSGKRLWPLSNDVRSKQFMKVLQDDRGNPESMIQRIIRQIRGIRPEAEIYVVANAAQSDPIRRQLGNSVTAISEPLRKNTYPAILLAGAYLLDREQMDPAETIAVLPVDPYVEYDYFEKIRDMDRALSESGADICLIGVKPTYPSEKYGYIVERKDVQTGSTYKHVEKCVEKPDLATARSLVATGARWNGGVFVMRGSYVAGLIKDEIGEVSFDKLYDSYENLPTISFDYRIIEKSDSLIYEEYDGEWNDIGTWNTMTKIMKHPNGGNVISGENCVNTHVINELEIPVVALGLTDTVVVASADGILVSNKGASSFMAPYVERVDHRPMYEKRQWGEYRVLDISNDGPGPEKSLTKRLWVEPGRGLSCQLHHYRDEIWTVTEGEGLFMLDGNVRTVHRGEILVIEREHTHAMASKTGCSFVEVQLGTDLVEEDIERFEWDWEPYLK